MSVACIPYLNKALLCKTTTGCLKNRRFFDESKIHLFKLLLFEATLGYGSGSL